MNKLTKSEEQIMLLLWELEKASISQLLEKMPDKPAYNTVSTIVRILEKKQYVSHTKLGKGYIYHPIISKKEYSKTLWRGMFDNYFNSSPSSFVSYFMEEENIDKEELKSLIQKLKDDE